MRKPDAKRVPYTMSKPMARPFLLLCLLVASAAAAEPLTLVFTDGKKKTMTPLAYDAQGLKAAQGEKEEMIPWADLEPLSAYAACKALTPYDDGPAILELARVARRLKLFPEALEQLEIALALGGLDEAAFEKEQGEIAAEEVEHLTAVIDGLLETDAEPERCLAAIKRLKERYPAHEANAAYEPHVKELVAAVAAEQQAVQDAASKDVADKALVKLQEAVAKEQAKKEQALATAARLREEAGPAIELRQVSRARKKLVEPLGAEKHLKEARKRLRNIARLDPQGLVVKREDLQREYGDIEKLLVDGYLKVARILIGERNYKGAVEYVRKVLLYDPINEEALDMAEEIRKNRIHFKASEISNTKPRVKGG
jgi:tetratricopeptide (TPR) repeat protein